MRALTKNLIQGVTEGFESEINGLVTEQNYKDQN